MHGGGGGGKRPTKGGGRRRRRARGGGDSADLLHGSEPLRHDAGGAVAEEGAGADARLHPARAADLLALVASHPAAGAELSLYRLIGRCSDIVTALHSKSPKEAETKGYVQNQCIQLWPVGLWRNLMRTTIGTIIPAAHFPSNEAAIHASTSTSRALWKKSTRRRVSVARVTNLPSNS